MGLNEATVPLVSMQAQFSSLTEYLAATGELGWDQDFRQLDRATGPASIELAASYKTQLLGVQYSNCIHQQIAPPKNCLSFGILAGPQAPLTLAGREVHSEQLMHFGSASGLDAVVQPRFRGYTLSFDEGQLFDVAQRHQLPQPSGKLASSTSARDITATRTREILQLIQEVMSLSAISQAMPSVLEAMESTLPRLVLQSWHDTCDPRKDNVGNRSRALGKALDYINSHPKQAVTVEQLCLISATSISTLERAFKEQFGVSPKRYLVASRLSGAHRALLDRNDQRSITEVAFDWSFWHMGKFASDYKSMFGQLPSLTRQNHGQRPVTNHQT